MRDALPKHIVLSRKGWDSKAGGRPSPILPDGTPVSLPIPDRNSGISYNDVQLEDGRSLGPLVESLTRSRIKRTDQVHLDPDLLPHSVQRPRFLAAFGQSGAAQSHLRNQGVGLEATPEAGDLFLFFGLYRPVQDDGSGWKFTREKAVHLIFGWLQIGRVITLATTPAPTICTKHPHAIPSYIVKKELGSRKENNNTLYVARPTLSFAPDLPGAGVFGRFDLSNIGDPRRLTKYGQQHVIRWSLPSFFSGLSNMGDNQPLPRNGRWEPQRRGPGQEFVLNTAGSETEVDAWLPLLFGTATTAKRKSAAAR